MSADGKVRVLVIDGYREERQYWADCLRMSSKHYEVIEAQDGRSGIQLCQATLIHCVVLEILLPDISGFGVLRGLCHMPPPSKCAVVVLTRIDYPSLLDLAQKNGAMASLAKSHTTCHELDRAITRATGMARNRTMAGPSH
ncbi:MAG TPA: response regulator [Nitrospira sp.]|nr:response regulator [Nitrospira sp.]